MIWGLVEVVVMLLILGGAVQRLDAWVTSGSAMSATDEIPTDVSIRPDADGITTVLVKTSSNVHSVAGSILHALRSGVERLDVRAIGAGAVNQAAKGCAIARTLGAREGLHILYALQFKDVTIDGQTRSAVTFQVVVQPANAAA